MLVGRHPGAIPLQFNTIHCMGSCVAPLQVCLKDYIATLPRMILSSKDGLEMENRRTWEEISLASH